ncbi:MAG: dihydrodipicolinate synthase family protein [Chloroflexota bacterium]|nr:dihydrodipicolinate synthase family protein [Chloroflexota bacterium]
MSDYQGVWPVAPTPFTESGALDLDGMKSVIDCIIDQGVDGVCILANYSEQFLLSDEERKVLTRLCLEYIKSRIPAIVTISHYSTDIVVARAREAHTLGADMVMMMPPYHGALMRGTTEQIYDQFAAVSKIGIPIMVQDAPISGIDLPVDLLIRMAAEIEQVKCFKIESAQAASKLRRLVDEGGETIQGPFDGEEGITLLADLQAGATGNMPSALLPDLIIPVVTNHRLGNRQKSIDGYNRILPLINYENKQCGFRAAKTVMMEGNVIKSDRCRHPVPPLAPQVRTELLRLAQEYQPLSLTWGK